MRAFFVLGLIIILLEKGSFVVFVIYLVSNISSVKKIEWSLLVAFKLNWYFV